MMLTVITLVGPVKGLKMETLVDYESFILHGAAGTGFILVKSVKYQQFIVSVSK